MCVWMAFSADGWGKDRYTHQRKKHKQNAPILIFLLCNLERYYLIYSLKNILSTFAHFNGNYLINISINLQQWLRISTCFTKLIFYLIIYKKKAYVQLPTCKSIQYIQFLCTVVGSLPPTKLPSDKVLGKMLYINLWCFLNNYKRAVLKRINITFSVLKPIKN